MSQVFNGACPEQLINVCSQPNFNMVLVNKNTINEQAQITLIKLIFVQNIIEYFNNALGDTVNSDHRVGRVGNHCKLIGEPFNSIIGLFNKCIISFLNHIGIASVFGYIPYLLTSECFELFSCRVNLHSQFFFCYTATIC